MNVVLRSSSLRRIELLKFIYEHFEIEKIEVDESKITCSNILDLPLEIALSKNSFEIKDNTVYISCDTMVKVDDYILGKPSSINEAKLMLKKLSNKTHYVISGLVIRYNDLVIKKTVTTEVTVTNLSSHEIDKYIDNNYVLDKAGSYAIQSEFAKYVTMIIGDYYNIMGLPLSALYQALKEYKLLS